MPLSHSCSSTSLLFGWCCCMPSCLRALLSFWFLFGLFVRGVCVCVCVRSVYSNAVMYCRSAQGLSLLNRQGDRWCGLGTGAVMYRNGLAALAGADRQRCPFTEDLLAPPTRRGTPHKLQKTKGVLHQGCVAAQLTNERHRRCGVDLRGQDRVASEVKRQRETHTAHVAALVRV
jgi:hypothetical protein